MFKDFIKATSGKHAVTSSLPAWYSSVKKFLIEEEEDEDGKGKGKSSSGKLFRDIVDFGPAQSGSGGDQGQMTVKHKKEQEELIGEEERRLYSDLIKDIKQYTDSTYMMWRKMKKLVARYVM